MVYLITIFYVAIGFIFVGILGAYDESSIMIAVLWPFALALLIFFGFISLFIKLGEFILKKLGD